MEATYTIIGGDGQQYGPIALEQIKAWITEGRVGPETKILRSDTQSWLPAAQYSELGLSAAPSQAAPPPVGTATATVAATSNPALEKQLRSGADWFFWIAGLSLVNSLMALSGSGGGFVIGLGVTRIIDAIGHELGGAGNIVGLALDILVVGIFVLFGVFARKAQVWSFIAGMVLYGLDGALLLFIGGSFLSIGFHAFALFCIFVGFRANCQLNAQAAGRPPS